MVEELGKDEKNAYFTESLTFIAEQIVDEAEAAGAGPTTEGDAPGDGEASKQENDNTDGNKPPAEQPTQSDD
jgi:hypothetical protein